MQGLWGFWTHGEEQKMPREARGWGTYLTSLGPKEGEGEPGPQQAREPPEHTGLSPAPHTEGPGTQVSDRKVGSKPSGKGTPGGWCLSFSTGWCPPRHLGLRAAQMESNRQGCHSTKPQPGAQSPVHSVRARRQGTSRNVSRTNTQALHPHGTTRWRRRRAAWGWGLELV